ncbi:MAG: type IV pili twitching motility protein PilT [Candidatus Pacebacteria bacterium RIFOXYB1_FULL_39_46]|nr:MAG: type IV pili twitching motility protein PilT [Candidatus Pacebacteria bacterium RIFOXYA1_FULL_38_18]OGJ38509.1 MAG: type IV pili twitching motility protein PilT [Candidatus Pacebacteria bacterium RIFOXYB1_FULL_39_46]OGJ40369.1 MAG: type IV pili twitching motility protein PilT [Candidatus Pacebacteria bacterium RIFOXYC1_FULL_39_21]OGJ40488.1 MAG: type IV pili twitching motility protein PilT [Candidatus Pacebacteria bacterium RIFOXYD1_FULL_39_27]
MTEQTTQSVSMEALLNILIDQRGSDLHLLVDSPPTIRVNGELTALPNFPPLTIEATKRLVASLMTIEQIEYINANKELDFGYQYKGLGRFRVNVYQEKGQIAAALRLIPAEIMSIDKLGLPDVFHQFTKFSQGLILVTGPTGEGKSTTLAAVIDEINRTRREHIVTIEDPIEFIYKPNKSLISQRELNRDTHSWNMALRSVLREDPDVVLIGELRDYDTIASAITIAETGHLVLGTLHTSTAAQTVDRIIDVFPSHQQDQVRTQLASTLSLVASQRLVPRADNSGLQAVFELLIANSATRNLIRENKTHQIDNVIQTSAEEGMMLMETNLASLVNQGVISREKALRAAMRPNVLIRLLGNQES